MDPVAFERAIRHIAEQRIQDAAEAGAFDNLPGKGKPLADVDEPYDENWWIRKWTRRQNISEPGLRRELRDAKRASSRQQQQRGEATG